MECRCCGNVWDGNAQCYCMCYGCDKCTSRSSATPPGRRRRKRWHISCGNDKFSQHDYDKWYLGNYCYIHGASEDWAIRRGIKRGQPRWKQIEHFIKDSSQGDIIFLFDKGKIKAYGIYNGSCEQVKDISKIRIECPGDSPRTKKKMKDQEKKMNIQFDEDEKKKWNDVDSYKIYVDKWIEIEKPLKGAGVRKTLYEITEKSKNQGNYDIPISYKSDYVFQTEMLGWTGF